MDDIFEELYYQFVYLPKKDACPERTARWEPFFHDAPLDLVDAKDGLVYNASLPGFSRAATRSDWRATARSNTLRTSRAFPKFSSRSS